MHAVITLNLYLSDFGWVNFYFVFFFVALETELLDDII